MSDNKRKPPGRIISLQKPNTLTLKNRAKPIIHAKLNDSDNDETKSDEQTNSSNNEDEEDEEESSESSEEERKPPKIRRKPGSPPRRESKAKAKSDMVKIQSINELEPIQEEDESPPPKKNVKKISIKKEDSYKHKNVNISFKIEGADIIDASYDETNTLHLKLSL